MEMLNKINAAKEILGSDYNVIKEMSSKKVSEDKGPELWSPGFKNDIKEIESKIGQIAVLGLKDENNYRKQWAEAVALWDGAKAEETKWL